MTSGFLAILIIFIIAVLAIVLASWFYTRLSKPPGAKTDLKTQLIVQRFYSSDLKKRAFIVHRNDDRYKVVYQHYSEEVINLGGEVVGWQSLPEHPVTLSLAKAVEIAQRWLHAED